ncbi:MAG TPA: SpoIIE family protein phosphatase [Bacteroidia bacterium]|jgi:serine phosphatase RsbU (regulator of sigma subunit)|nr:SpoIIE family protein phosphatase [Bacteroidia bacterium]
MFLLNKKSLNNIFLLFGLLLSLNVFAAKSTWSIEVKGTVTEKGQGLQGAVISLFSDSVLLQKVTSPDGDFSFILHADTEYMFTFSKPGYVSKCITFSTKDVPLARAKQGFSPYDIEVSIFKKIDGVDIGQLLQAPLALIRFNPDLNEGGDFMYDEKYAKSIKPFLAVLDFEIKQEFKRAEQEKQVAVRDGELKKQKVLTWSAIIVLLLVLGFAIYAYRSFTQKRKMNHELDFQNKSIEQKNREITDSISYAKRIQDAILPTAETVKKVLPDSFILFKPKDIVSGDFYFFLHNKEKIYFGAADCTGHGVPGAFMSLIGYEKLYDASHATSNTGDILSMVNKGIRKSLRQTTDKDSTRDGMDIALCCIQKEDKGMKVSFSGANRPLWVIRKGASSIEEFKPTKKAIGGFTEEEQGFDLFQTQINEGDTLYMFSDGYADQFGGDKGKKLTTKKFREILLEIKHLSMNDQLKHLENFIDSWRNKEEQLDDILVLGVRV